MSLQDLGLEDGATEAEVISKFKDLAKSAHPDRGGSAEAFQKLQDAKEKALEEVRLGQSLSRARIQVDALRAAARGTLCPRCNGTGSSGELRRGFVTMKKVCRLCRGRGRL